jgi:hypothetical protein
MNAITYQAQRGEIHLLAAPRALSRRLMNDLAAQLALRGPALVLDGANLFDAYAIARQVRRSTHQLEAVLEELQVARAFTCYQMLAMLAAQQALTAPLLVFGLLTTFRDENVPLAERRQALERCLGHLQRLARRAPVIVNACVTNADWAASVNRPANIPATDQMLARLAQVAGQVWRFEALQTTTQARLF